VPILADADAELAVLFNRNCLRCHTLGGVGGTQGPVLTTVGDKLDEAGIRRQIERPKEVKPTGDMPAFLDTLTPDEIAKLARWLASHRSTATQ